LEGAAMFGKSEAGRLGASAIKLYESERAEA
jgi:hypothetical protein